MYMNKTKPSYKRQDDRGTFLELVNGEQWLSINSGYMKQDAVLGNHYHLDNTIHFITLDATVRVEIQNVVTKEYSYDILTPGEGVIIPTNEAHRLTFITPGHFILLKSMTYFEEHNDIFPFDIETKLLPFE